MALSLQLGYPDVPKSITNPNVRKENALDVFDPIPFLTFIKIINVTFEPDSVKHYYSFYVKTWNSINSVKKVNDDKLISDKYREFIKDITINFTTLEEREYLSKLDFNDEFDMDIALSFYSNKIVDIIKYHNNKRHDIVFNITRKKLKGTNLGSEKTIKELIINYIKNYEDSRILLDFNSIVSKLEIEFEELYDIHPTYFNQTPDEKDYGRKDLDYGLDIFLKSNPEIISEFFSDLSDELLELKEIDDLLDNKRKLTSKSLFTDYYYLSTGNTTTQFLSGKILDASDSIFNFLNREYPTTASIQNDEFRTEREIGFFKPNKQSIVLIDGKTESFYFNLSNLEPNKIYYFPDPNLIGKNGEVITFIIDDSFLKRNISSGVAKNQPTSNKEDTKYYGYQSKYTPEKLKNLEAAVNFGHIKNMTKDIYGNIYGLFDSSESKFKNIEVIDQDVRLNLLLDGWKFYDDLYDEGYDFDFTTEDDSTYTETVRTGLSTYTNGFLDLQEDIVMFPGFFSPDIVLKERSENVPQKVILEGAFITDYSGVPYPDAVSSDLSAFESSSGIFYYDSLIECGVYSNSPITRALLDPSYPSISANASVWLRGLDIDVFDGGDIINYNDFDVRITENNFVFEESFSGATTFEELSNAYSDYNNQIIVKDINSKQILPLLHKFPNIISRYPSTVVDEIEENVQKIETSVDSLIIQTSNYLVIEKIKISNGDFVTGTTSPIYVNHSSEWYDKISNRIKVGNDVFYCKFDTTTEVLSTNSVFVYPRIYKYDGLNNKNIQLYPTSDITYFSLSTFTGNIPIGIGSPTLTHNERNNMFKISLVLTDMAGYPTLHEIDFKINPDVEFLKHKSLYMDYSTSIVDTETTVSFFLSSGPYSINTNYIEF